MIDGVGVRVNISVSLFYSYRTQSVSVNQVSYPLGIQPRIRTGTFLPRLWEIVRYSASNVIFDAVGKLATSVLAGGIATQQIANSIPNPADGDSTLYELRISSTRPRLVYSW